MLVAAIIIGIFSESVVWLGDDIAYGYSYDSVNGETHLNSVGDIIPSMNAHYMSVNGRYVAHVLVQYFCGIAGQTAFSVCNGLVYILFFLLVARVCGVHLENGRGILTIVLLSLITFQTKMMPSCQIGFVWMFTLTLGFLILFFSSRRYRWWETALLGLYSLIAGNGQEALNIGVCGALIIYWALNMRKMTAAQYIMMICFGLGALADCLSPGTLSRASEEGARGIVSGLYSFGGVLLYMRAGYFLLAVLVWAVVKKKFSVKKIYSENSFLWNVLLICLIFNMVTGFPSNRSLFGFELTALIIGVRLLPRRSLNGWWLALSGVILGYSYFLQAQDVMHYKRLVADIRRQYALSPDGKVYADADYSQKVLMSMSFMQKLYFTGHWSEKKYKDTEINYTDYWLQQYFHTLCPGRKPIQILPVYLRGLEHEGLDNRLVKLQGENTLFIQAKNNPKTLFVSRRIDLPLLGRDYGSMEFNVGKPQYEGDNWNAWTLRESDFTILGLSESTYHLK